MTNKKVSVLFFRCRTGSQWRSWRIGLIWSDLLAPVTRRAAAFCTTCSLCSSWLLTPASIWNGHCACAVPRDLSSGAKMIHIFRNPWPQFTYSLCHFPGTTTNIKPCYRWKIAFSHCESYKVQCTCAVSRGVFENHTWQFLIPNYLFAVQLIWGYDDD